MIANVLVKFGEAADMGLVDKNLGDCVYRLAGFLTKIRFADALGPHIYVAVPFDCVGALQACGELLGEGAEGAAGTTVDYHEHDTTPEIGSSQTGVLRQHITQPRHRYAMVRSAEPVSYTLGTGVSTHNRLKVPCTPCGSPVYPGEGAAGARGVDFAYFAGELAALWRKIGIPAN